MILGILQPGYLPWLGFFEQMNHVDQFVIHDELQYTRRSWRARNYIRIGQEKFLLTVPALTTGRGPQRICDVRIDNNSPWSRIHREAIFLNYRKAPFFDRYADFFDQLYRKQWEWLAELDAEIIRFCAKQLGITTEILLSSEHQLEEKYLQTHDGNPDRTDRVIFLCQSLGSDEFYEGAAGEEITDIDKLAKHGIRINFQNYSHPAYPQMGEGFIPHLSIIDLMFCCGPDSLAILIGQQTQTEEHERVKQEPSQVEPKALTLNNVTRMPEMLNIEVTSACQLHCVFCPRDDMTRKHGEMSLDLFQRLVDECAAQGTRLWMHYMGDPLLHSGIFDMLRYAKKAGIPSIGMSTNVLLLTKETSRKLIETGLDRLEMSIDALDAEGYKRLRADDRFDKVVAGARGFFDVRRKMDSPSPIVTLSFMNTPENRRDWPKITEMWASYLQEQDFVMAIDVHTFAGAIPAPAPAPNEPNRPPCPALWLSGLVLWNGDVALCSMDYDGKGALGNLNDQSLEAIWNSETMNALRAAHVQGRIAEGTLCADCTDWRLLQNGYEKVEST